MSSSVTPEELATLEAIQRRVLWLAVRMVHEANHIRPNPDKSKVGGHQASSASVVSILTALYFHFLRSGDRVSVKPHASPVFHAIQYLLGRLPRESLTRLRSFHGLQAYPSRTKDPDPVDFSTGSVGLGATAPTFAALAHHYALDHFGQVTSKRFVAVVGDAELDEGNIWEAILDEALAGLGNLLWVVDLNRQSLDRVVPGIRAGQLKRLFAQSGWQVLEAKYGRALQALFARPGGEALRRRIDDMSNEEYQSLIQLPGGELRPRLATVDGRQQPGLAGVLSVIPDENLPSVLSNLGGHDLAELLSVLAQVAAEPDRPAIIFAYTIKGWGLPMAGNPLNHSMLLSQAQIETLAAQLGVPAEDDWAAFPPDSAEGRLCAQAKERLEAGQDTALARLTPDDVPAALPVAATGEVNTQATFGRLLMELSRAPLLASRIVTAAPDVATSTNLAGWVIKSGLYAPRAEPTYGNDKLSWPRGPHGQHIELGISEMNLFMALGMFGLSAELVGQPLIPIGTVYDTFVARGLDSFIYALYSEAKFIVAGTPSGTSLAPEGGAHQSTITPSLGIELPNLNYYEPCFAQELEWIFIEALRQCCDREHGRATYLRLSTKPIDQGLLAPALARLGPDQLRQQVLAGGYRLRDWRATEAADYPQYLVHIATSGVMAPEALEAARLLEEEGIPANVLQLTSPRRLYEAWQGTGQRPEAMPRASVDWPFDWLIPPAERHAPIITVHDGASHALAWLGAVFGSMVVPLGVDRFGQSGRRADLYANYGIDAESIFNAAMIALQGRGI
jgi:pyruvate dehydrogenase E1 component